MKTDKKNIKQIWGVLCGASSIDQDTNSLSLFNIIEEITVHKKQNENTPKEEGSITIQIPLEIILMLTKNRQGQTAAADMRVDLLDPEGKSLQNFKAGIEIKKEHKNLRFRIKSQNIKISVPGTYTFRVSTKEAHEETFSQIGEMNFDVKITA